MLHAHNVGMGKVTVLKLHAILTQIKGEAKVKILESS